MVAIVDPEDSVNLASLAQGVDKILASYARPIFVRKVPALEMTGTYKVKKHLLQKEVRTWSLHMSSCLKINFISPSFLALCVAGF